MRKMEATVRPLALFKSSWRFRESSEEFIPNPFPSRSGGPWRLRHLTSKFQVKFGPYPRPGESNHGTEAGAMADAAPFPLGDNSARSVYNNPVNHLFRLGQIR